MGRFFERYKKHPERGTEHYYDQISAYAASLLLGRNLGEGADEFYARCPSAKRGLDECREDRLLLEGAQTEIDRLQRYNDSRTDAAPVVQYERSG